MIGPNEGLRGNSMRSSLKKGLCALYKHSGLARAQEALNWHATGPFLTVLLFHRVTDLIPEDPLTVSTASFRKLCRLLRRRFHVVPLSETFRLARVGGNWPARLVAITFDDCYRDNLDAARVLAEHDLPATFFIPTAFVGTDHVFPWDRNLPRLPNLDWDDVREMARMGFEIGSHTVHHVDLGAVGRDEARRELAESRAVLQERLGKPVRYLAYPFGGVDNLRMEYVPLALELGYEGIVSGHGGKVYPGGVPHLLPRQPAPPFRNLLNLELFLRGSLDWFYRLKDRLGLLKRYRGPGHPTMPSPEAILSAPGAASPAAASRS